MVYEWKPSSRLTQFDANIIGAALEKIHEKQGKITAAAVVKEARPEDSPLHPVFEWDDHKAAEEYRLEQARHLIRSIVVKDIVAEQPQPVRAFVVVTETPKEAINEAETTADDEEDGFGTLVKDQCYKPTIIALSDPVYRQQVLTRALRELQAWREKYRALSELAKVFETVDAVIGERLSA